MDNSIYTNKRKNVKEKQFAALQYVPNKLVFIEEIGKDKIHFYFFNRENGEPKMSAKKSTLDKKCIKDFNPLQENFNPLPEVLKMINDENL